MTGNRTFDGRHTEQSPKTKVTQFETSYTLLNIKLPMRIRTVGTEENIASVAASVNKDRKGLKKKCCERI